MLADAHDVIRIVCDEKIEPPRAIDACLPQSDGFIVFFGMEGWMTDVAAQKTELFVRRFPQRRRQPFVIVVGIAGKAGDAHSLYCFAAHFSFRFAWNSRAEENSI